MDKLKENMFPVSVGAIAVALLALAYFLIWVPLSTLTATERALTAATKKLDKYSRMDYVPTDSYVEYKKEQAKADATDIEEAVGFQEEKTKRFNLFFDDRQAAPNQSTFTAVLDDRKKSLLEQYQVDFKLQPAQEGAPQEGPPRVDFEPPALASDLPLVMKEYWIFEEFMNACTKLKIGGVETIDFEQRSALVEEEFQRIMQVKIVMAVPYSKIEDLISELYASDRVPFLVGELIVRNQQSPVEDGELAELVKVREFLNRSESDEQTYAALYPEPPCGVELTLQVPDWKGIPDEEPEEPQ